MMIRMTWGLRSRPVGVFRTSVRSIWVPKGLGYPYEHLSASPPPTSTEMATYTWNAPAVKVLISDLTPMIVEGTVRSIGSTESFGAGKSTMHFVLNDPGNSNAEIKVSMYNDQVRNLGPILKVGMSVRITGFNVRPTVAERLPFTGHAYELSMTRDSRFELQ